MKKLLLLASLAAATAFAQYKLEAAGAPPSEVAPAIREALQKEGLRIVAANGKVFCEIWLRAKAPLGAKTAEQNVSFTQIQPGSLLGVLRFPAQGADRRGQVIKAGVYTLRLAFYPLDGAHQGVAPLRDFLKIIPAGIDADLNATPTYDELVKMSTQASGTSHPAILSAWRPDAPQPKPSLVKEGEDWVLYATMGEEPIAILVVGAYQG